jgi:hypothetical protein
MTLRAEPQFDPDPALIVQGWQRRFTADMRRVQEAVRLYTELGYEVLTVPVNPEELSEDCSGCRLIVALQFQTIYTRRTA